ncbi:MAG TPA: type II toxin-antitoxin system VapC family toxin [Longimicrobium sp.]|nr:type II toxin-antitoxin system VapC family toxin [Longimicrobium sp.]
MGRVLVDTNVLMDVFTEDPVWFDWSAEALANHAENSVLVINPIIYAEASVRFDRIEDLEEALPADRFEREPLPWEAAFLAGKSYLVYRKRGSERRSPLPDFYIGAHAAVRGMALLTRDAPRYRTYFPALQLIAP